MTFDQSPHDQNSVLKISVMVVDDDPVFLQIMSRKLEKAIYKDPSIMEITVVAVKDAREALSTLKIQRNNIDLIVTDYYMPGMNGLQLKKEINQEFGNLPVIVISLDPNKEQESLTCGVMCFIPKPIEAADLTKIYQIALTCKRDGMSILCTEHNQKDTNVTIPQQIQLLPDQATVSITMKNNKLTVRSNSRSMKSSNPSKKNKLTWNGDLNNLFFEAIQHIGLDKAAPKKILEFMNVPYLTREHVASHLQKYRLFLKKVANKGSLCSSMLHGKDIGSRLPYSHIREPNYSNHTHSSSLYDTSFNNISSYSKPGQGLGQSRLLSNTAEPVRLNQMPYNYMNRLSTYEPHRTGSNWIKSNLSFSTQPSQNEGRKNIFEPTMMANKTGQTSQVLGFGQHGLSAVNGINLNNNNMMRSYGGSTSNQPVIRSYESSTSNQLGMSSHGLTPNQPGVSSHGIFTPTQPGMSSYGILTSNQLGMSSHGSLSPNKPGVSNHGSLTPNQLGMSSHGSLSPNQPGVSSHGNLTPNQPGMSSHGSLSSTQPGLSSHGNLTPTQPGMNSYASLTSNQPGLISFESLITNQPETSSYGSLTPKQPGPRNFSYGMQSFLNNENTAYKPQPHPNETIQPNLEIPEPENLNWYDDLINTNELPCDISNFQFDHNKQEEDAVSTTKFELPANFLTELDQNLFLEEDGDSTFVNVNQGRYNEEPPDNSVAPETNYPTFNITSNHDQEQDVPDFVDWSLLDPQVLDNENDFMDSLFTNNMN